MFFKCLEGRGWDKKEAGAPRKGAHPGWGSRSRGMGVEAALPVQNRTAPRLGKLLGIGQAAWDWAGYFGLDSQ